MRKLLHTQGFGRLAWLICGAALLAAALAASALLGDRGDPAESAVAGGWVRGLLGGGQEVRPLPEHASGYPPLADEQVRRVRSLLAGYKGDPRGPYLRIRWFCNDGSVLPPDPGACREHGGGHQHAELKPEARELADLGFHPGTILRATSYEEFVDREHAYYRLRELVVENWLFEIDDGWVLRRARYYRGARQIEDEEQRGREFLERLLADPEWRADNPLLATQLARAVPHGQPGVPGARIRTLSQRIAELDPRFQDLRIKIHSRPGSEDLETVATLRARLPASAAPELRQAVAELEAALRSLYTGSDYRERLAALARSLSATPLGERVGQLPGLLTDADERRQVELLAALLRDARRLLGGAESAPGGSIDGRRALALLDLINYAGGLLERAANEWARERLPEAMPGGRLTAEDGSGQAAGTTGEGSGPGATTRAEILAFAADLADAAYGVGLLLDREHDGLRRFSRTLLEPGSQAAGGGLELGGPPDGDATEGPRAIAAAARRPGPQRVDGTARLTAALYKDRVHYLAHALDWAQAAAQQTLGMVLERYVHVEPAAAGIIDHLLRGSVLLPYAAAIDVLSHDAGSVIGLIHSVFEYELRGGLMGLNPGVAVGPLYVVGGNDQLADLDPDGIYVLPETPADLGRVAGILTLGVGSRLSHVQLLARSLGLPNAVVPEDLLGVLREHRGERVFYAVSPLGMVVLKPMAEMSVADRAILEERAAAGESRFAIDESELDLEVRSILPLQAIDLDDSGHIVGPKAANLGRLHSLFPDRVAPGLVIPFGVFRAHIDRDLLGSGGTLYEDLVAVYESAELARRQGAATENTNRWLMSQLERVREAIVEMDLLPGIATEMRSALRAVFGEDGTYGVFVRSDTNVEDLPNFTGAGLNLTVMNTIGTEEILDAIKRVWASPFSERSYTWRQRLLETPANVYPSVILLQSVPVEASGVLVTADLTGREADTWTVTLSEGIGGVVEGEPAETTLVPARGGRPILLSSARAVWQRVLRMAGSGGIERVPVRGEPVLLTDARLRDLRAVVREILDRYPPALDERGEPMPWDIEFGFLDDRVVLFQIRPLVEDRHTRMTRALAALDSAVLAGGAQPVSLDQPPVMGERR